MPCVAATPSIGAAYWFHTLFAPVSEATALSNKLFAPWNGAAHPWRSLLVLVRKYALRIRRTELALIKMPASRIHLQYFNHLLYALSNVCYIYFPLYAFLFIQTVL